MTARRSPTPVVPARRFYHPIGQRQTFELCLACGCARHRGRCKGMRLVTGHGEVDCVCEVGE